MKLLFDENLSPRLVQALEPEYPGSAHVRTLGLRGATDGAIWERAQQAAYAIVSKDMMMGDTPVSNTDPYATTPTTPDDWVTHVGPHMMVLIPNKALLKGISKDHRNGGPWIMWPDTPYAHIMIPFESRGH